MPKEEADAVNVAPASPPTSSPPPPPTPQPPPTSPASPAMRLSSLGGLRRGSGSRDSPRRSSPRTPRTNRAAEVRIQSKQRSHSLSESNQSNPSSNRLRTEATSKSQERLTSGGTLHRSSLSIRPKSAGAKVTNKDMSGTKAPDVYQDYEELPKVPIPPLKQTLDQYLDNLRAIYTDDEYRTAEKIVQEFGASGGVGEKAIAFLEEKQANEDNWCYQYWLEDMYLNWRLPLPVNFNPGMVFPKQNFRKVEDMLSFSSKMIMGFIKYKDRLDRHTIPQERATSREPGQPMCMEQYYRIMTSYRRPGKEKDILLSSGKAVKDEETIVVGLQGHWYSVPVKEGGKWKRLEDVYASLLDIVGGKEGGDPPPSPVPVHERVSVMSANNRTKWAESLEHLETNEENQKNMKILENCLLILCIDEETQNSSDEERSLKDQFRQMLTGGGTRFNGTNRWFDKTVQLVVTMDGVCGICYEHSTSEGIAVVQLIVDILKDIGTSSTSTIAYHPKSSKFTKMEWVVDSKTKENIQSAMGTLDKLDLDNDLEVFRFTGFGKEFIKSCRCSPDAFLQLALQLTIYGMYGYIVPTYESASTRRFRLGRVDSIRASHPEALAWCKSMLESKSKDEKKKCFEEAIKKQTKVMVDNILGNGLDIPLLGLREATKAIGEWNNQSLFTDPAAGYDKINEFRLSTSQVPVELDPSFMGYGAVVPDGFGVSYNPYKFSIIFCIGSFHSSQLTNSRQFARQLQNSLSQMQQLFTKGEPGKHKL